MKRYRRKLSGLGLVILLLVVAVPAPAEIGAPVPPVKTFAATITQKTDNGFYYKESHYLVTRSSDIRDESNRKISFSQVWVPCVAEIGYRLKNNHPVCITFRVKEKLKKPGGQAE